MKNSALFLLALLFLGNSCQAQEKEEEMKAQEQKETKKPETAGGAWKVHREFDESGNLIRYDSIYSWSSEDAMENLETLDRDSLLQAMRSRFYRHFTRIDSLAFPNFFGRDSLFTKGFFDDGFFKSDFGRDFLDIDHMRKRLEAIEEEFLRKYQSGPDPEIQEGGEDMKEGM